MLRADGGFEWLHDFVADEGELAREVEHGDGLRHLGMVHGGRVVLTRKSDC